MVRSAAAVLACLILPGFLAAQQTQTQPVTHTVVKGDCLWNLATSYYQDPWDWRKIWNANKDKIEDPNLIYPGQVFVIPDKEATSATVTEVTVEPGQGAGQGEQQAAPEPAPAVVGRSTRAPRHTVFYRDTSGSYMVGGGPKSEVLPVSRGEVYAAPWLVRGMQVPAHLGVLKGEADLPNPSETVRSYDRVVLDFQGAPPQVGERLLLYRVTRSIDDVGQVVSPTGTVTITDVGDKGVNGVITAEYGRIMEGDLVGPIPDYALTRGQTAQPVSNGPQAMVMGMARSAELSNLNSVAFLDLGSDDGVAVGDEFELRDWAASGNVVEARLQVVGVKAHTASARVIHLRDDVVHQGVVVQLAKKMD